MIFAVEKRMQWIFIYLADPDSPNEFLLGLVCHEVGLPVVPCGARLAMFIDYRLFVCVCIDFHRCSMIFGAWVLSEVLPLRFFAALALILCGLAISQWASLAKLLRR